MKNDGQSQTRTNGLMALQITNIFFYCWFSIYWLGFITANKPLGRITDKRSPAKKYEIICTFDVATKLRCAEYFSSKNNFLKIVVSTSFKQKSQYAYSLENEIHKSLFILTI